MNMELIRPCKRRRTSDEAVEEKERDVSDRLREEAMSSLVDNDGILTEILLRVPCKPAYRFKAVCKRWNSMISSNYYIARYNAFYRDLTTNPESFTLMLQFSWYISYHKKPPSHPLFSLSSNLLRFNTLRRLDLSFLPTPEVINEASSQDLMLCRCFSGMFYVVNPVTRQWVPVPAPPTSYRYYGILFDKLLFKTGLVCLDGSNNSNKNDGDCYSLRFKVIRIPTFASHLNYDTRPLPPKWDHPDFKVQIFCSQSNKWRKFVVDWYPFKFNHFLSQAPIVSHDGMLHWINGHSLVSLDPVVGDADNVNQLKLSRAINLPVDLGLGSGTKLLGSGVCKSRHRVITISHILIEGNGEESQYSLSVWELDDEGGAWKLCHKVLVSDLLERKLTTDTEFYKFLAFHPHDGNVIFLYLLDSLYQLNLETKRSDRHQLDHPYRNFCILDNVVPPLLCQWFPTPLPSPLPYSSSIASFHNRFNNV